ncbi:MAG: hypothetical protein QXD19_03895 [Candidatus Bathyarchaeia archaeon]
MQACFRKKYDKVSLNGSGDVLVKIDDVDEFWRVIATLADLKINKDVEIQTPTIEDVFLKITGGIITEEGELK